jgi:hypothetical protein
MELGLSSEGHSATISLTSPHKIMQEKGMEKTGKGKPERGGNSLSGEGTA